MIQKIIQKAQYIANIILFLTFIAIAWQSITTNKDFRLRNKPVVAVGGIDTKFLIPENEERKGKLVLWQALTNQFICEGKPIELSGFRIITIVKNYGPEPALEIIPEAILKIGTVLITTEDKNFIQSMLMPGQDSTITHTVSKIDLYRAFINNENISINFHFKYNDLTKRRKPFEYSAEVLIVSNRDINPRIINGSFKN